MKILLLLIVCVYGSRVKDFDFIKWKEINSKKYLNKEAEEEAFNYFQADKLAIDQHNINYAKGLVTFARAVNQYSDWSPQRKRSFLNGFILNTTIQQAYEDYLGLNHNKNKNENKIQSRIESPDFVDWRLNGYVTQVQDQGNLNIKYKSTFINN
jgi:hypothetical protein